MAVFIFKVAFDLVRTGLNELLERSLPADVEEEILRIVTADPEVCQPHNLRTRRIGAAIAVEVHVRMDGAMTVARSHALTVDIERRLRARFGEGTMIAIHVEPLKWPGGISSAAFAGSPEARAFILSAYGMFLARILFVLGGKNVPEYCRRSRKIWYFRKKCLSCQRKASENSDVFKARTRNCNDIRQLKKDRLSGKKSTLSN